MAEASLTKASDAPEGRDFRTTHWSVVVLAGAQDSEGASRALETLCRGSQPRLFIHGHQHVDQETLLGATRVIGVYGQRRLDLQ